MSDVRSNPSKGTEGKTRYDDADAFRLPDRVYRCQQLSLHSVHVRVTQAGAGASLASAAARARTSPKAGAPRLFSPIAMPQNPPSRKGQASNRPRSLPIGREVVDSTAGSGWKAVGRGGWKVMARPPRADCAVATTGHRYPF